MGAFLSPVLLLHDRRDQKMIVGRGIHVAENDGVVGVTVTVVNRRADNDHE